MQTRALLLATILLALPLAGCADTTSDSDATPAGTSPASTSPASTSPAATPASTAPAMGVAVEDDFESATAGGLPAGWSLAKGEWEVVTNASGPAGAKVLQSDQTDLGETLLLNDAAGVWGDLEARVMFNVLDGVKGQAGGIAFRYEDERNYYVVRYNHNELSWNLFRYIDGDRQKFEAAETAVDFTGALHQWTELRLEARGAHIQVFSGNVKVIDYTEESSDAPTAGKIGLWTRYDSLTQFDDFSVAAK